MHFPTITDAYQLIGLFGVFVYIVNYALLQLGVIRGNGFIYPSMVLVGAVCVLLSMLSEFSLSSAVINAIYVLISFVGIGRLVFIDGRVRFSQAEKRMREDHFPTLSKRNARRFFDAGFWISAEIGSQITGENEPVTNLVYIEHGLVEAVVEGRVVGRIGPNSFVGEITALTGAPATATTIVRQDATIFSISAEKLRAMVKRDAELKRALDDAFGADMRAKLVLSNTAGFGKT